VNQAEPEDDGRAADSTRHVVTFEEIVAGWVAEGTVPGWPETVPHPPDGNEVDRAVPGAPPSAPPATGPTAPPVGPSAAPAAPPPPRAASPSIPAPASPPPVSRPPAQTPPPAPDEHFVPPDPPPMPRIGVTAAIGIALLGLGVVLLALPSLLGRNAELSLPLGLVALALGLGWLVLRSWPAVGSDDEDDDGAVL